MAQGDYLVQNQGFPAFRSDLNSTLEAINTSNSGTSRPTSAVAGTIWLDTTSATSPTLKFYDGTDDISLATIDYSANTVNWLDSTVSITGLATTATGTVLTLTDSVSTSTVNLIIDNQKEIRFRETTANGTNYVALKAPASLGSDVTFTLPSADGTANQVLKTDGSGVLSFATASTGLEWQSTIVTTSTLTSVANKGYWINTTSNACTITLPASASVGDQIIFVDYARNWGTNAITINLNGLNYQGGTENPVYDTNGQTVNIVYSGATNGWIPISDDDVAVEGFIPPYSVDFLVVAGGGGGGGTATSAYGGGGGGAGGYRNSFSTEASGGGGSSETSLAFTVGTVYTITVGAGGAGGIGGTGLGANGVDSSISGSDISTITSTGGGGGGFGNNPANPASSGGSGGGGGGSTPPATNSGASGTANQGFAGGNGNNLSSQGGGGGGGSSAIGSNASGTNGGNGGNGLASSISGSSVTRAGGGGGGIYDSGTPGTGGTGGGGNGGVVPNGNGGTGTVNTGSGGGGGQTTNSATNGGAGAKGVVILSMPLANFSGTVTGSPTESDDGTTKRLIFNDSGSYTG
jgi:hypothetical protein